MLRNNDCAAADRFSEDMVLRFTNRRGVTNDYNCCSLMVAELSPVSNIGPPGIYSVKRCRRSHASREFCKVVAIVNLCQLVDPTAVG